MRVYAITSVFVLLATACNASPDWQPGTVLELPGSQRRGLIEKRGIMHLHSVYSHDACDEQPQVDGKPNTVCLGQLRAGLCKSRHSFAMLSDHPERFADTPFIDALLFDESQGDELILRDGGPVASWMRCPQGHRVLITAGAETDIMPLGLEGHVPGDAKAVYASKSASEITKMRDQGAVIMAPHPEDWTIDELAQLPIDGFEMFNMHNNAVVHMGDALELVLALGIGRANLPHPDVALLPLMKTDERYMSIWGSVLARGVQRATFMGTDAHQNLFDAPLSDDERVDSYRRLMVAFSNHVLVSEDLAWDDLAVKHSIRQGRIFGVFEILGYPSGFDYRAETPTQTFEMGSLLQLADQPELIVQIPRMKGATQPLLRAEILRAVAGGWEVVASSSALEELRYQPEEPGAYRTAISMLPSHLEAHMGDFTSKIADEWFVWIYSNPIYVQ